jgi:hypothetical protein
VEWSQTFGHLLYRRIVGEEAGLFDVSVRPEYFVCHFHRFRCRRNFGVEDFCAAEGAAALKGSASIVDDCPSSCGFPELGAVAVS